jgi:hypothetical protein
MSSTPIRVVYGCVAVTEDCVPHAYNSKMESDHSFRAELGDGGAEKSEEVPLVKRGFLRLLFAGYAFATFGFVLTELFLRPLDAVVRYLPLSKSLLWLISGGLAHYLAHVFGDGACEFVLPVLAFLGIYILRRWGEQILFLCTIIGACCCVMTILFLAYGVFISVLRSEIGCFGILGTLLVMVYFASLVRPLLKGTNMEEFADSLDD